MSAHTVIMRILAEAPDDERDKLLEAYAHEQKARQNYKERMKERWQVEDRLSLLYLGKSFSEAQVEDEEMA